MSNSITTLVSGARRISKRLLASYILDWLVIILIAFLGAGFNWIEVKSTRHAFNLSDPSISYPYHPDTVSMLVLGLVAVAAPALITAVISITLPFPSNPSTSRTTILRRKIWEWNAAWLGLGLALASTLMITEALKDLAGKPRPYLLNICNPDLSPESIRRWRVGGLGPNEISSSVPIVVTWQICQTSDSDGLHNAFASWPSGHSSISWAGMTYLTLFLCAKFGVHIPLFLPSVSDSKVSTLDKELQSRSNDDRHRYGSHYRQPRDQAAAPPLHLLLIAAVPVGAATYIALSRWFDYRHHGIDVLSGSLIGAISAYLSFRMYHLPIQGGAGWAWGARRKERAFWLGIGVPTYVSEVSDLQGEKPPYDMVNGHSEPHRNRGTARKYDLEGGHNGSSGVVGAQSGANFAQGA